MVVEHPTHPGLYPPRPMILEVRECATLGTNFADVYLDGKIFAKELSRTIAETFVKFPEAYTLAFIDVTKMRTWAIEREDAAAIRMLRELGEIE
jgi:hypothetical protein